MSKSGKGCYPHNDIYMYLTGTLNGSNYDDFKQLSMSRQSTNWGFIKFIMKIPYGNLPYHQLVAIVAYADMHGSLRSTEMMFDY